MILVWIHTCLPFRVSCGALKPLIQFSPAISATELRNTSHVTKCNKISLYTATKYAQFIVR